MLYNENWEELRENPIQKSNLPPSFNGVLESSLEVLGLDFEKLIHLSFKTYKPS